MDVNSTGVWRRHCLVPVQYLSDIPAIQPAIFDGLRGKGVITQHRLRINQRTGRYILRVVARNQAGVGPGNTVLVDFEDGITRTGFYDVSRVTLHLPSHSNQTYVSRDIRTRQPQK